MNWERPLAIALEEKTDRLVPEARRARDLCRQRKYGQALDVLWAMLRNAGRFGFAEREAFALIHMGAVYRHWIPGTALKFLEDGLAAAQSCGFRAGELAAHNAIGELYYALGDPNRALEYFKLSLQTACDNQDRMSERDILLDMVNCYEAKGDLDRCDELVRMALHLEEAMGDTHHVCGCSGGSNPNAQTLRPK